MKLRELPTHTTERVEVDSGIALNRTRTVLYYTAEQVRAIQLEAARDAREAAAQAMAISDSTVWGVVAGDRIRAIQLEQPC